MLGIALLSLAFVYENKRNSSEAFPVTGIAQTDTVYIMMDPF